MHLSGYRPGISSVESVKRVSNDCHRAFIGDVTVTSIALDLTAKITNRVTIQGKTMRTCFNMSASAFQQHLDSTINSWVQDTSSDCHISAFHQVNQQVMMTEVIIKTTGYQQFKDNSRTTMISSTNAAAKKTSIHPCMTIHVCNGRKHITLCCWRNKPFPTIFRFFKLQPNEDRSGVNHPHLSISDNATLTISVGEGTCCELAIA